jgi:hypothetical protein
MPNTIRLVNRASDATVLYDFDQASGASNPNGLKTTLMGHGFNLGVPPSNTEFFESEDSPGGTLSKRRHGLTQMSFFFRPEATSSDNLFAAIGKLGQYLDNPIEYALLLQLEGWAEKRYADLAYGAVPALLRGGDRGLFEALTLLKDPQGIEVLLWRQPYLRGPSVTVGPTTVQNDPAGASGRFIQVTNNGNAPAPATVKVVGDTGAKVQKILVARKSAFPHANARVTDYTGTTKYGRLSPTGTVNGWTVAAYGTDTTSVADTDASGGTTAQTTHSTNPTVMAKRIRITRTALLDSLRGTFDVYARIKNTAAAKHVVQLRWAHSLADPATFSETEVIHDTTGLPTFAYVDVRLGRISVPQGHMLGGLAFEFWSRRDSGSGNLMWDFLSLVPADESVSTISVPAASYERWKANQFLTPSNPAGLAAGTFSGGFMLLDAANEAAGTPPNTGLAWPVGRHRIGIGMSKQGAGAITYTFRVRNITDSSNAASMTVITASGVATAEEKYLEFDSVSAKSYQPQVVFDSGSNGILYLDSFHHWFRSYIASGERVHSDPTPGMQLLHKMDASDNVVLPLNVDGPTPVWAQPGLNALYIHYEEVPVASSAPGGESKLTRNCSVTISFSPRYLT